MPDGLATWELKYVLSCAFVKVLCWFLLPTTNGRNDKPPCWDRTIHSIPVYAWKSSPPSRVSSFLPYTLAWESSPGVTITVIHLTWELFYCVVYYSNLLGK